MNNKESYNEALSDVKHLAKEVFYPKGADFPMVNVDIVLEFEKKLNEMKFMLLTTDLGVKE